MAHVHSLECIDKKGKLTCFGARIEAREADRSRAVAAFKGGTVKLAGGPSHQIAAAELAAAYPGRRVKKQGGPTTWEVLTDRLGHTPNRAEWAAYLQQISDETIIKLGTAGKLPYQRQRRTKRK